MNDVAMRIPDGMKHLELPVEWGTLELQGRLIDVVDNDRGRRQRWAEIRLYRYIDTNPEHDPEQNPELKESDEDYKSFGQQLYLVYTIGHSVVYHEFDSPCNKGIQVRADDFLNLGSADYPVKTEHYKDLEACEYCDPPSWRSVPGDTLFEVEVTWYRYRKCRTGEDVLLALRKDAKCKRCFHKPHEFRHCNCGCQEYAEAPRQLSIPGQRLVNQVKRKEPEIASAAARKVRL